MRPSPSFPAGRLYGSGLPLVFFLTSRHGLDVAVVSGATKGSSAVFKVSAKLFFFVSVFALSSMRGVLSALLTLSILHSVWLLFSTHIPLGTAGSSADGSDIALT